MYIKNKCETLVVNIKSGKMKNLNLFAWISGIIALILMFFGFIDFLFSPKFLFVNHSINYFHVANSFLLLTICIVLLDKCTCKTEE